MNPYAEFLPPVLGAFGFLLQWLRQFKAVHDTWVYVIAFALANAGYWLVTIPDPDWRMTALKYLVVIGGYTSTVIGGTFTAARLAPSAGVIPTTNSK